MPEYYGVSPSSDFFAHYGIKGMQWGVRKAIEKGNSKRLARNYNKALKKLDKLNSNTHIDTQKRLTKQYNDTAKGSLAVGATGAALATNQYLKGKNLFSKLSNAKKAMDETSSWTYAGKMTDALSADDYDAYNAMADKQYNNISNYYNSKSEVERRMPNIMNAGAVGIGLGIGGLTNAAIYKGKSIAAKKRMTPEGHKKAIAKRNEFHNEMEKVFSGAKAKGMLNKQQEYVNKAIAKSLKRQQKERAMNKNFAKKQAAKQAKARARLEAKIGKLN